MKSKLLEKIPKVALRDNSYITSLYTKNQWILRAIPALWGLWLLLIPLSGFPISLNKSRVESLVIPDFGTGKFYTKYRSKDWDIDFI